ncbi:MAG: FAD-dependent oxidoreductase [Cyanothece sp. SIO1E1]|nr:FAD-dependent oxidoreductase [Cyanothece sp. SIO1E1]
MITSIEQKNGVFADSAFTRPTADQTLSCSILIVGGSTAAYAAALTVLKANLDVCLVQPQTVVGGQFTAQALPASDDGSLLRKQAKFDQVDGEKFAISKAQHSFRERQRELQQINGRKDRNPGGGWVSPLSTTPIVAATALNEAIAPYLDGNKLTLIPFAEPVEVLMGVSAEQRRRVQGVVFKDWQTEQTFTVNGKVVIEATDLGDLLEVGNIASRVGQEARHETGEQALPEEALPQCQQSFTFDVLVERTAPGQGVPIGAPVGYDREAWLKAHEFRASFWMKNKGQWEHRPRGFFDDFGIFRYRRLQRLKSHEKSISPGDITVLNWGVTQHGPDGPFCCGNDYRSGELVGVSREERQTHLKRARDRAQAYVHYLQSNGIDLKPRGDLTWTEDGIALEPYIREARRGVALTTIRHEDVSEAFFPNQARAKSFGDSVGIGQYHYLDLHGNDKKGHASLPGTKVLARPFTIPLGSLVPIDTDGLVLSAKSIGTTHITNAAYRMHPVEWAIGEASGFLATLAVWLDQDVRAIATDEKRVRQLQGFLTRNGIPIFWFDDIAHDDPDFEAIQVLAAAGIVRSQNQRDLHFRPATGVSRAVVATALVSILRLEKIAPATPVFADVRPNQHWAYSTIETLYAHKMISGVGYKRFAPDQPMTREHFSFLIQKAAPEAHERAFAATPKDSRVLQRRELSRVLYEVLKVKLGLA